MFQFWTIVWRRPLGFSRAIELGLAQVHSDWVYLLNSDMTVDENALAEGLPFRQPDVFSVGSQIFLQDTSGRRIETNWTRMALRGGLVEVWDEDPGANDLAAWSLYSGGGSSLFQSRLLKPMVKRTAAYDPFYWEDVEWGTVALRHGYRNVFCPTSRASHRRRATVAKFYGNAEVERTFQRNRFLFQLRNIHTPGGLEAVFRQLASGNAIVARELMFSRRLPAIVFGRWRHAHCPISEKVLFGAPGMHS